VSHFHPERLRLFRNLPKTRDLLPTVMLSEVGAHATTQSKHPGAAGCNDADTGSSTEIAVVTAAWSESQQLAAVSLPRCFRDHL
jgi:hypothetical protein